MMHESSHLCSAKITKLDSGKELEIPWMSQLSHQKKKKKSLCPNLTSDV